MNRLTARIPRRGAAALATAALAASATGVLLASSQAQAFVPGFPDLYCYAEASGNNLTRLWLGESNMVNGDPRLAYTIIHERNTGGGVYEPYAAQSKYELPPADRSPSGICRWADAGYGFGVPA